MVFEETRKRNSMIAGRGVVIERSKMKHRLRNMPFAFR
jgi:hypothetical protein